jgi:hypothetical protein
MVACKNVMANCRFKRTASPPLIAALARLGRIQHKFRDVTAGAFACGSVLRRQPAHIAQVAHLRALSQQHQHPLVYGVHQHHALALLGFGNGLARPTLDALMVVRLGAGSMVALVSSVMVACMFQARPAR